MKESRPDWIFEVAKMLAEQLPMNTAIENTALLIQPFPLQRLIWQQILKSQGIHVITGNPDVDPATTLTNMAEAGDLLPQLLLIDQQLPDWNWEPFCQWCQQHYPDVKIILLSRSPDSVTPLQRQAALQAGVVEVLPAFEMETIALSVIHTLKPVLGIFGQEQSNDALAASIVNIKREVNELNLQPSQNTAPQAPEPSPQQNLPAPGTAEQPVPPPPQPKMNQKKRIYRGRIY